MPDPLARLERLLADATPRPWAGLSRHALGYLIQREADAALIVALVNAAPHLIAVAKAAEDSYREVLTVGTASEWETMFRLGNALAGLRAHLGETEA